MGALTFEFLSLHDFKLEGQRIFLRVDINSPIDPSTHDILDDTRLKAACETVNLLSSSKVVIGSHQSRPGKDDFTSLESHARRLRRYCSNKIRFIPDVIGPAAIEAIKNLADGEILVLDNLRMAAEENLEGPPKLLTRTHFVRRLAPLFDLYVNDAFAAAHRAQPSLVGLAEALPAAAGLLMEKELRALNALLGEPKRPCVYILGGAKVEDKIPVIEHILSTGKADKILTAGKVGKIVLKAMDYQFGKTDEEELAETASLIMKTKEIRRRYPGKIEIPEDVAVPKDEKRYEVGLDQFPLDAPILDIGKKTIKHYVSIIEGARTIVADGPLGVFERNGFDQGTREILVAAADCLGYTVIGGGHLAGLTSIMGIQNRFTHVSTAGGAMLSLLSGRKLPAIEALIRAAERYKNRK